MQRHLLLLLTVLGLTCGQPVLAATINVPGGQPTIQAGITAASPGDTVLVAAGMYVENVNIDRNVALLSVNGRALTEIQGISSVGALGAVQLTNGTSAAQIGAPGQGFTIVGIDNGNPGVENAAVYFQGSHSNARILDNEIVAAGDHGLLTEFGATNSGFEIDGNEFSGQTFLGPNPDGNGFGDQFTQPNRPRQLAVISGGSGGGNTSNVTFTNNEMTGTAGGYNPSGDEQGNGLVTIDSNGATITGNTFAGTTTRFASSLRCRGPATSISGNLFSSVGIQAPLKATAHVDHQNTGETSDQIATGNTFDKSVYVAGLPVGFVGWSIQAFVLALPSGFTIQVGPGTYVEQVIVDGKDLTIQGANKSTTFLHSPPILATTFTTSGPNKPIVSALNSTNVRFDGFTIDGLGLGNANNRFEGVAFYNAGGALTNCCVKDIDDTPQTGVQHGVGIFSFNTTGGPYVLEVGNCEFTGYQKNGMALSGDGMVVDVHDCTTTGSGDVAYIAQNGIQISYGAGGTVTDCTVADMRYTPATWVSSGILTFSAAPVVTSGNILITDTQAPVSWYDTNGTCGGCEIPNGGDFDAIFVYNTTTSRLASARPYPRPYDDALPDEKRAITAFAVNVVDGCLTGSLASGTSGIYALATASPLDLAISNMRITDWDYGVFLDGAGVSCSAGDNRIAGSSTAGLDNGSSGNAVGAEFNWWGAADGPGGDGTGSGDSVTGGFVDFDPWRIDDSSATACAFTPSGNTVAPVPGPGTCISNTTPCVSVPVDIARTDNAPMRAFSVTFTLSPELDLCSGLASITEGTYLDVVGGTTFQKIDNGGGSYTVDGAILGLPCGATAAAGTLFDVAVKAAGGDGTGSITVTALRLRDCVNGMLPATTGAAVLIPIDTAGPAAVADLASSQVKTGNDGDGTTKITVTFTAPGDVSAVEVYRKGFGDYPEYDDGTGALPSPPTDPVDAVSNGWVLTGVASSGDTDEPANRDFWYYVIFTQDACGNGSAVSNMTNGTLNYHLGDVSDGVTPGDGDNMVSTVDVSLLGANYGIAIGFNDPVNYLDVGPTTDLFVDALPTTDDLIEFEDLMMFAINFSHVSRLAPTDPNEVVLDQPALDLVASETGSSGRLTARLVLHDNARAAKGFHSLVTFDRNRLELLEVEQGELLERQGGVVFFKALDRPQGVLVDAAAMGSGLAISGSGDVAVLHFRVVGAGARPVLAEADLRNARNRPLGRRIQESVGRDPLLPSEAGLPVELELLGARPNPFGSSTEIVFRLPTAASVSLRVYDVNGRLVRTLVDRSLASGEVRARWDGRTNDGSIAGAGVYFYTFQASDHRETRKLVRFR